MARQYSSVTKFNVKYFYYLYSNTYFKSTETIIIVAERLKKNVMNIINVHFYAYGSD